MSNFVVKGEYSEDIVVGLQKQQEGKRQVMI